MSTNPRLPSAVPDETPSLPTVLAHAPAVMESFSRLYAYFWQQGTVPATIKEMTRIRNARITDCGY